MKILITGASGFVGSHLGIRLREDHRLLGITNSSSRQLPFETIAFDIRNNDAVTSALHDFQPELIVHLAALSQVIPCEDNPDEAAAINVTATARLAEWAAEHSVRLIFASTDQVFDGHSGNYRELDKPEPVNHYGRTKWRAELVVLAASKDNLVVRSNSVVGPSLGWGSSFSDRLLRALRRNETVDLFHDQYRSPIHVRRMIDVLENVCVNRLGGFLNAGGPEPQSRFETGVVLAKAYHLNRDLIRSTSFMEHPRADIMHPDGTFDISYLRRVLPDIAWKTLQEEFEQDFRLEQASNGSA